MFNISTKNDKINIESEGKGLTLLLEAISIVSALYDSLSERDEMLGATFQGVCKGKAPYIRLTDIMENKDDSSEEDQEQTETDDKIKRLLNYIFNRSEDEDEG